MAPGLTHAVQSKMSTGSRSSAEIPAPLAPAGMAGASAGAYWPGLVYRAWIASIASVTSRGSTTSAASMFSFN